MIKQRMVEAEKSANLSKSKWIARLSREKAANEWPQSVIELAGTWEDFPSIDDIRSNEEKNVRFSTSVQAGLEKNQTETG